MSAFVLPAGLKRGELKTLRGELAALVAAKAPVQIDGSCVIEADGPGIQILLAARRSAHEAGLRFELVNPSSPLRAIIEAHHVSDLIDGRSL